MQNNAHYLKFQDKSTAELIAILDDKNTYSDDDLLAVFRLLRERKVGLTDKHIEYYNKILSRKMKAEGPASQKVSISETLSSSFKVWKENLLTIAIVITIVYLPIQSLIELVSFISDNAYGVNNLENGDDLRRLADEARIYDVIRQLLGVIATLGIFNFVYSLLRNEDKERSALEIVKYGLKKWPQNFIAGFKAGLIIILYTLLLIIPGIYKAVQYAFISCVISDDEDDPLEKSKNLVEDNWFNIFGLVLLIFIIGLLIEIIIFLPVFILPDSRIVTILFGVAASIAASFLLVFKANYYVNLKRLKLASAEIDHSNSELRERE